MKGIKDAMKAPTGLGKGVLGSAKAPSFGTAIKAPSLGKAAKVTRVAAKLPTLKDLKVPKGGLMNKELRQSYGKVRGLNT